MKISDLDSETKAVIVTAHWLANHPSPENMERLKRALVAYDEKHADERAMNAINALWGPNGILQEETDKQ